MKQLLCSIPFCVLTMALSAQDLEVYVDGSTPGETVADSLHTVKCKFFVKDVSDVEKVHIKIGRQEHADDKAARTYLITDSAVKVKENNKKNDEIDVKIGDFILNENFFYEVILEDKNGKFSDPINTKW